MRVGVTDSALMDYFAGAGVAQNRHKYEGDGGKPSPKSLIVWRARRELNPRPLD